MSPAIQESKNGTSPYTKPYQPYQLDIKEPLGLTECAILALMELYVENQLDCYRFNLVKVCREIFPQISQTGVYRSIARLQLHKLVELVGFKNAQMRSLISNAPVALRQLKEVAPELYCLLPSSEEFVRLVKNSMGSLNNSAELNTIEPTSMLQNQVSKLDVGQQHLTEKLQSLASLYEVLTEQHAQLQLTVEHLENKSKLNNSHLSEIKTPHKPSKLIGNAHPIELNSGAIAMCNFEFNLTEAKLSGLTFTVDRALTAQDYLDASDEISDYLNVYFLEDLAEIEDTPSLKLC